MKDLKSRYRNSLLVALTFLLASLALQAEAQTKVLSLDGSQFQTKSTGGIYLNNSWRLWSDGYIETSMQFPISGPYYFQIEAFAVEVLMKSARMDCILLRKSTS